MAKRSYQPIILMNAFKAIHSNARLLDLETQRKAQSTVGTLLTPPATFNFRKFKLGGMNCMWTNIKSIPRSKNVIVYCHGGGYIVGDINYCKILSSKLAYETGMEVVTFEYPLAPEHPYPAQNNAAMAVWNYLTELGIDERDIYICGESAGGHLVLCLCNMLKEAGRVLPAKIVLLSAWTDLTLSGTSYRTQLFDDPMVEFDYIEMIRRYYAPDADYAKARWSPLFSDFSGYPPCLIHVGENEILQSDSTALYDAMRKAGVECSLKVYPKMWHVFHMFPISDAEEAMKEVGDFIKGN